MNYENVVSILNSIKSSEDICVYIHISIFSIIVGFFGFFWLLLFSKLQIEIQA